MRACIFLGPTLRADDVPEGIDIFPPAALGSVFQAVEQRYDRIGIVDGLFGNVPSVWHKEILYALSKDIQVFGAASLGALRAAELYQYGMVGVGRIFRLYRANILTDDDEVAVIHSPAELGHAPLSEAMVNIRYTLRALHKDGVISKETREVACDRIKGTFFAHRRLEQLVDILRGSELGSEAPGAVQRFYVDMKRLDALALLARLGAGGPGENEDRLWLFPETEDWIRQFVEMRDDLPALRRTR